MKALALAPVLALAALTLAAPAQVEAGHRHGRGCGHSYYDRGYSGNRGGYGGTRYYDDYYGGRYYGRGDYGRDYERRYYGRNRGYRPRGYGYGYSGYPAYGYGYGYGYYPPPPPVRYCRPRPRVGIYFGF